MKLGLWADKTEISIKSSNILTEKYDLIYINNYAKDDLDAIIIFGGDGFMLHSMHNITKFKAPLYGMNCGTIGFLLNEFNAEDLLNKIRNAKEAHISPLNVKVTDNNNNTHSVKAYNEVSLLRETRQSTNIEVKINAKTKINHLVGDGILVATPAGSSAYNFSVKGPIIPLCSDLLALTPISPFRPRQWRGALLPGNTIVDFIIHDAIKRPVSCVVDYFEFRDISAVNIQKSKDESRTLLFDSKNPLQDKLITEQFL